LEYFSWILLRYLEKVVGYIIYVDIVLIQNKLNLIHLKKLSGSN